MSAAMLAGTPKYQQRDNGAEIYALQSRLADLGYFNIKLTGIYGTVVENAFKQFQFTNGFDITGIVTDEELEVLYSIKAKPKLESNRLISSNTFLNNESFQVIEQRVTPTFEIKLVTLNKTATFNMKSSGGHLVGELTGIDLSKLNQGLRYPVIATIQNVNYPASLDLTGTEAHLHFKESLSYLGIPDSEHQYNISALLGF